MRLRGALEQDCWLSFEGIVYGRGERNPIIPLIGFSSLLVVRYLKRGDGWIMQQRESNHYTDLNSGEPADAWSNPYTNRINIPIGYISPLLTFEVRSTGTYLAVSGGERRGNFEPDLASDSKTIWSVERRANAFESALTKEEFPDLYVEPVRRSVDVATYRADQAAMFSDVSFIPAATAIMADTPWLDWMLMGARPGHVMWHGVGSKTRLRSEVDEDLLRRVDMVHPGFLDAPWTMDRSPYSSREQMRRLRAEGRI